MDGAIIQKSDNSKNEKIFGILFQDDEITWQNIIYELINSEQMDPWDIDIGYLAKRYIETLKKLKSMDFRLGGKVILAAAILLNIKSDKFLKDELSELARLMQPPDEYEDEEYEEFFTNEIVKPAVINTPTQPPEIIPRTPQPRERKVSVYDLIEALNRALEVKEKRKKRARLGNKFKHKVPEKKLDMTKLKNNVLNKIRKAFRNFSTNKIRFSHILQEDSKKEKVFTFMPLLYLAKDRVIDLEQKKHLDEIYIIKAGKKPKKVIKKARQSDYFKTKTGITLKDLEDLAIFLEKTDLRTFKYHVNNEKNDFAVWVEQALNMKELAQELQKTTDLHTTKAIIIDAIN